MNKNHSSPPQFNLNTLLFLAVILALLLFFLNQVLGMLIAFAILCDLLFWGIYIGWNAAKVKQEIETGKGTLQQSLVLSGIILVVAVVIFVFAPARTSSGDTEGGDVLALMGLLIFFVIVLLMALIHREIQNRNNRA